jgi:hypothetical protein
MSTMPPNDGSASLLFFDQQQKINKNVEYVATDDHDLLGMDTPAVSQAFFDPFANSAVDVNDDDIMSLASELTQGAIEIETAKSTARAMKMNDAFTALEKMRVANLEIEFGHAFNVTKCVQCIMALPAHKRRPATPSPYRTILKSASLKKKPTPCLMCGCPTCKKHCDESFRKSKVIICEECSPLFSLDFVVDCVSHKYNIDDPEAAQKQRYQIKHMIDVYDRVRLMLEYSSQYIDEIADTLEKMTKKEDKIGLGCNTSGVASGVAGVCAAACFVTPAGPPLLIASLLFSGVSQLTTSSTKMVNYYSTPSRIAFKIISLYNLCKSVLTVTTVLRDALLKDHINLEKYVENMIKETEEAVLEMKTGFEKDDEGLSVDETAIEDDGELSDDESLASMSSAGSVGNMSTRTGIVSAYSDITDFPLSKIHEADELDYGEDEKHEDTTSEILTPGFAGLFADDAEDEKNEDITSEIRTPGFSGLFANANDDVITAGVDAYKAPQDRGDEKKPVETIDANTNNSVIVMAEPRASNFFYRSPKKAQSVEERFSANSEEKVSPSKQNVSPSKQEQIDRMRETNDLNREDGKVGQLARFYSRGSLAGSSLVSATVTMMAAGACLSLVTFAFEANNLAATIKRIQAGSPSKRAQALRVIKEDVANMPDTNVIAEQWDNYLEVLRERHRHQHESDETTNSTDASDDID